MLWSDRPLRQRVLAGGCRNRGLGESHDLLAVEPSTLPSQAVPCRFTNCRAHSGSEIAHPTGNGLRDSGSGLVDDAIVSPEKPGGGIPTIGIGELCSEMAERPRNPPPVFEADGVRKGSAQQI